MAESRDASRSSAGILAHEVGHNSHDHIGQQLGRARRAQNIMSLGGLLGNRTIGIGSSIVAARLMRYSREEEKEADDRAVDYTIAAGIDPDGLARFFSRLEGAQGLRIFQSHPNPDRRVPRIRARIASIGAPKDPLVTSEEHAARRPRRERARSCRTTPRCSTRSAGDDVGAGTRGVRQRPSRRSPATRQFHFWKGVAYQAEEKAKEALPSPARRRRARHEPTT